MSGIITSMSRGAVALPESSFSFLIVDKISSRKISISRMGVWHDLIWNDLSLSLIKWTPLPSRVNKRCFKVSNTDKYERSSLIFSSSPFCLSTKAWVTSTASSCDKSVFKVSLPCFPSEIKRGFPSTSSSFS